MIASRPSIRDGTPGRTKGNSWATRLAGEPDPGRAVRELIVALIETSSTKLTLISLVGENGQLPPAVQEATRGVQAAIGGVLARAQDAGVVAGDVTVEEFFVLVRGSTSMINV